MGQTEPGITTMPIDESALAVLSEVLSSTPSASVLDLGGGTGVYAVPLAAHGHRVQVLDQSPDALATLRRRAESAGVDDLVRGAIADLEALGESLADRADDLVLCHRVLEYVDDPESTLRAAALALAPEGRLSVITVNRDGAALSRIVSGRMDEAARLVIDSGPAARTDVFDLAQLSALAERSGLAVEASYGLGLLPELCPPEVNASDLRAFNEVVRSRPALRAVAPFAQLILRPLRCEG